MSTNTLTRLAEERKAFRKDRPFGFQAKPATRADGSVDMMTWQCIVPGKPNTYCEGGNFPVTILFTSDYPAKPPHVKLPGGFLHINVFPEGYVCLSLLKEVVPEHLGKVSGWMPSISVKEILLSIQELLHNPNPGSVANEPAFKLFRKSQADYEKAQRQQTSKYLSLDD